MSLIYLFIFFFLKMSLDITRSFVENKDGTYEYYDKNKSDSSHQYSNNGKNLPIRPFQLNTYLKVGKCVLTRAILIAG